MKHFFSKLFISFFCFLFIFVNISTNICHAETIGEKEETLAKVFRVYKDLLSQLTYDESDLGLNDDALTFGEEFSRNLEHIEKYKKGVCIQLSHYLISKLYDLGIKAWPLYMYGNHGNFRHVAVLYEAAGEKFVADITADIIAVSKGETERINDPWFWKDNLNALINYEKKENKLSSMFFFIENLVRNNVSKLIDNITSADEIAKNMEIIYNGNDSLCGDMFKKLIKLGIVSGTIFMLYKHVPNWCNK